MYKKFSICDVFIHQMLNRISCILIILILLFRKGSDNIIGIRLIQNRETSFSSFSCLMTPDIKLFVVSSCFNIAPSSCLYLFDEEGLIGVTSSAGILSSCTGDETFERFGKFYDFSIRNFL